MKKEILEIQAEQLVPLVYKVLRVAQVILVVPLVLLVYKDRPVLTEPLGYEEQQVPLELERQEPLV